MSRNKLFYGDNLEVLRSGDIAPLSVDLVYLDPPFNSNRVYNVLFDRKGDAQAQVQAFDDTWKWTHETDRTYELLTRGVLDEKVSETLEAMRALLGTSNLMAYLVNMTPRLAELHRTLKSTGSLYLHCDPTASHYLKIMLDSIFGPKCFRNEIIWRRTGAHTPRNSFGPIHDVILFYSKSPTAYYFNVLRRPYTNAHVERRYKKQSDGRLKFVSGGNVLTGAEAGGGESSQPWKGIDPAAKNRHWAIPSFISEQMPAGFEDLSVLEKLDAAYDAGLIEIIPGRVWPEPVRYLRPGDGSPVGDIWAYQPGTEGVLYGTLNGIDEDVAYLGPTAPERLGYPTQKPVGLLERIINASCPPDGIVLDPFCGCGTTLDAAVNLKRSWIGIDITYLSIDLIRNRLRNTHGEAIDSIYEVRGVPADLESAHDLFDRSPFDFERWAVSLVRGTPNTKQVADKGKDGVIRFVTGKKTKARAIVSVKGGKQLSPGMVRDLEGVVSKTKGAEMGVMVTLHQPTRGMKQEAETGGTYQDWVGNSYPKIQILSVEQLLRGRKPKMPPIIPPYTEAQKKVDVGKQLTLDAEESAAFGVDEVSERPIELPVMPDDATEADE